MAKMSAIRMTTETSCSHAADNDLYTWTTLCVCTPTVQQARDTLAHHMVADGITAARRTCMATPGCHILTVLINHTLQAHSAVKGRHVLAISWWLEKHHSNGTTFTKRGQFHKSKMHARSNPFFIKQ